MNPTQKTFSIVTIVLNDNAGFLKTAGSIERLTDQDFEWIVIDGASSDGTVESVEARLAKIAIFRSERDRGIYDAMNKGLRLATGEYVVFMNAGDEFATPNALGLIKAGIQSAKADKPGIQIDVILGGARLVFPKGETVYKAPRPPGYVKHSLPANHQSTFVRTELHQSAEFPDGYRVCGDFAAVARIISSGACVLVLDEEIALRDTVMESTAVKSRDKIYEECQAVQRDILGLSDDYIARSHRKRVFNQELRRLLTRLGSNSLGSFAIKSALRILRIEKKRRPTRALKLYVAGQAYDAF
tara:strand:+ start:5355 stop:6254 length:900 start_codon:yes stop_codon:yes gene_type:complete